MRFLVSRHSLKCYIGIDTGEFIVLVHIGFSAKSICIHIEHTITGLFLEEFL